MFYLVFIIWNKTIICTCPVLLFFLVNYLFYRNIIKEEEKKERKYNKGGKGILQSI